MSSRLYARVDLVVNGEWRVGAWEAGDRALLTFTTDGSAADGGRPYLPGASIRGSLRSHLRAAAGAGLAAAAFGPDAGSANLSASPWWVLAAHLPDGTWDTRERGQTGIDRVRRAPAEGTQRTSRVVTAVGDGPHVRVYLRADLPRSGTDRPESDTDRPESDTDPLNQPAVAEVLHALGTWRPRIGGGASTGLGRARVTGGRYRLVDLATRDGLLARARAGGGRAGLDALLDDPVAASITVRPGPEVVLLSCEFSLPHGWVAPEPPEPVRPLMDGSTWKGLIRSRVEYIGRSLHAAVCAGSDCGRCDVCAAFGSPHAAGRLDFASTPVARGTAAVHPRGRSAINRFTGGVNDRQLFTEHTEHDLGLRLEIRPLDRVRPAGAPGAPPDQDRGPTTAPGIPAWVVRAVLHAVRDLADGLVGVGGRTSTGLGTLAATQVELGGPWRSLAGDLCADDGALTLDALDRLPVEVPR